MEQLGTDLDLAAGLRLLERIPPAASELDARDREEVDESVAYLESEAALESLARDPYWPKWSSPWWRMLLLHERGQTQLIPRSAVDAMVASLDRMPVKFFPIRPEEMPPGLDRVTDALCHCAVGGIVPVLLACSVDVSTRLPWARSWFPRYQLADGGLTCDNDAYLVEGQVPSSMVGTVAPLEAMLALTKTGASTEEAAFMNRAVDFLISRGLTRGSDSAFNADERKTALAWPELTFPRFYFYDVLRGLTVLVEAAHQLEREIPWSSMREVASLLATRFPDGQVRIGRRGFGSHGTRLLDENGRWTRRGPASTFPLLEVSSCVGDASPWLSRSWERTRARIIDLTRRGLVVDA